MKNGFTLIELLIATAIFTLVVIAFIGVFIVVMGLQVRQSSEATVSEQSQFLLQKIQYYVELSSYVSSTVDATTSVLTLRMPSSSIDPTVISWSDGTVYLQQAGGALQPLTSSNVVIPYISFVRRSNPPGHDSVSVSFVASYSTNNIKQMFSQALETSVAQVSAATFDSDVLPSSGSLNLGASGQTWASINNIIDFSSGEVGINQSGPQAALDVNGGIRLSGTASAFSGIACSLTNRGTLWFVPGSGTSKDYLYVCGYDASSSLTWHQVW